MLSSHCHYLQVPGSVLCVSLMVMLCHNITPTQVLPSSNSACPTNCNCVPPTVTCNNTIPDKVPDNIVEVVLIDLKQLAPDRFCNVTWNHVTNLSLIHVRCERRNHESFYLDNNVFNCLGYIRTLKIKGLYSFVKNIILSGLSNITSFDLSEYGTVMSEGLTPMFSASENLPNLRFLNLSRSIYPWGMTIDQGFIDALSPRPIELLDLSHNSFIGFDFLYPRELCQTLTTLILRNSSISVENLPLKCTSLQCVDLSDSRELANELQCCVDTEATCLNLPIPIFFYARVVRLDRLILDPIKYYTSNCCVHIGLLYYQPIRELHFSHNYIPKFEILFDFYSKIGGIEYIDLSNNSIMHINTKAFSFLPYLRKVDLSANNLSYMPGETFMANQKLEELYLFNNTFKQLPITLNMSNLVMLDLRFNRIQYLNQQSMRVVDALHKSRIHRQKRISRNKERFHILLEGNPFRCDCEAFEFIQWFVTSPIFNSSYVCQLDGEMIPMTSAAVKATEYDCETPKRKLRAILLSTLLPVCTIAAVVTVVVTLHKRYKRKLKQQRLEDKLQIIQANNTRLPFTLFLSYCSLDAKFVVEHVLRPLQVSTLSSPKSNIMIYKTHSQQI